MSNTIQNLIADELARLAIVDLCAGIADREDSEACRLVWAILEGGV